MDSSFFTRLKIECIFKSAFYMYTCHQHIKHLDFSERIHFLFAKKYVMAYRILITIIPYLTKILFNF